MTARDLILLGTSSQQPTRRRNHGAYLLRWNEEGFLFDPGEGTQRQFIFADIAPPCVTRIYISHFHGDHCLGLGSMLMRLNLDKVTHPIHCYYPASGEEYFNRLRFGTIYHDQIKVIKHPIEKEGVVEVRNGFVTEAFFLDHGTENIAWRITEEDQRKFFPEKLKLHGIAGPKVREMEEKGYVEIGGKRVGIDDVSYLRKGDVFSVVIDTKMCKSALRAAENATLLLCESTYLESEKELAEKHYHLTARQAATIARDANAEKLVLTHYSARYRDVTPFEEEAKAVFPNTIAGDDFMKIPFERSNRPTI